MIKVHSHRVGLFKIRLVIVDYHRLTCFVQNFPKGAEVGVKTTEDLSTYKEIVKSPVVLEIHD